MSRLLFFIFIFFAKVYYVSAASAVGSLCFFGEKVVFSCGSSSGKTISLCSSSVLTESDGYLQYRYGVIGEIPELIYPKRQEHPKEHFISGTVPYSGGGASYLKFSKGKYSYTVFTGIGKGWEKEGVVVKKSGKQIAYVACDGPLISELGPALFENVGLQKDSLEFDFDVP
tara:strand:+ start:32634 stop:33146 length:513 start_codon:yes stop_codon:yes gene_type:complete